jgi:hypothetical protein
VNLSIKCWWWKTTEDNRRQF